jgi:hypothetical protein
MSALHDGSGAMRRCKRDHYILLHATVHATGMDATDFMVELAG